MISSRLRHVVWPCFRQTAFACQRIFRQISNAWLWQAGVDSRNTWAKRVRIVWWRSSTGAVRADRPLTEDNWSGRNRWARKFFFFIIIVFGAIQNNKKKKRKKFRKENRTGERTYCEVARARRRWITCLQNGIIRNTLRVCFITFYFLFLHHPDGRFAHNKLQYTCTYT